MAYDLQVKMFITETTAWFSGNQPFGNDNMQDVVIKDGLDECLMKGKFHADFIYGYVLEIRIQEAYGSRSSSESSSFW